MPPQLSGNEVQNPVTFPESIETGNITVPNNTIAPDGATPPDGEPTNGAGSASMVSMSMVSAGNTGNSTDIFQLQVVNVGSPAPSSKSNNAESSAVSFSVQMING